MYFRVESDKKLLGQNCISLVSLHSGIPPPTHTSYYHDHSHSPPQTHTYTGIKFVPLRTSGGELIPEAGLFVRIKKTEGSAQTKHLTYLTSELKGAEGLETIAEDVEASIKSAHSSKYMQRQEATTDPEESLTRRTMSSPPSISSPPPFFSGLPPSSDQLLHQKIEVFANITS